MTHERIVSLVPNATEILFALGAGDAVVGVSHECDFPPEARNRPQLTGSVFASDLEPAQIDRLVSSQLASGESLYTLDEGLVESLRPDLIVTQSLCPVCAVSTEQVDGALEPLPACPEVLSLDPRTLADVFEDIRAVGRSLGLSDRAEALVTSLEDRLHEVARAVAGRKKPRVAALEWLDPLFAAGHWVPEMIAAAGGVDALAQPGEASSRLEWQTLHEADPDCIVVMPCGFDEAGAKAQIEGLAGHEWESLRAVQSGRVVAVDANGCFSRPGPRLVDGVERLAEIFHGGI